MKKIISFIALILCFAVSKAQNNLQFNRAVLVRADSISNCGGGCPDTILYQNFTVPANKVWKIESINYNPGNYVLFLDGNSFPRVTSQIPTTYPIWLPSGTYAIYFGTFNSANSATGQYSYLLSALEFNVVQ
jgi:hypothetical protein